MVLVVGDYVDEVVIGVGVGGGAMDNVVKTHFCITLLLNSVIIFVVPYANVVMVSLLGKQMNVS